MAQSILISKIKIFVSIDKKFDMLMEASKQAKRRCGPSMKGEIACFAILFYKPDAFISAFEKHERTKRIKRRR